jgi:hypothetical protein
MKKTGVFMTMMKYLGLVVFIDLILIGLVLMIGWWAGWQTEDEFKNAIQIAGLIVIGIGFLGLKGNWDLSRSFDYQYSMSATRKSHVERTQQNLLDFAKSYSFMLLTFIAGGICLLISWLM